jgi:vacuolar-type H+-ATPase subunit I/STV1
VATLTIKNESGAKLEFATSGGAVKLDPGESKELSGNQLKGQGLADAILLGNASIQVAPNPGKDQVDLAKTVLPPLVTSTGARVTQLGSRFDQSQKELVKLREAFNKTWKAAESNLGAAHAATAGWANLRKAVKGLILDTEEVNEAVKERKDAVKALEQGLEKLKNENLADTPGRTLEHWYADRVAAEKALEEARAALANVRKEKSNPIVAEIETVEAGIARVQAIQKNKAIGKEIQEFGQ